MRKAIVLTVVAALLTALPTVAVADTVKKPHGIALDAAGNLYISDSAHWQILKRTPSGVTTRIAGTGTPGFSGDGGKALEAEMGPPRGIAVDKKGNVYFADMTNAVVRKITTDGKINTIAGTGPGQTDFNGDNQSATTANLNYPTSVAVDNDGRVYIADGEGYNNGGHFRVRVIDLDGKIYTAAGNGQKGTYGDGRPATEASLVRPEAIAVDSGRNLYIGDGNRIRKVSAIGIITTIAGNNTLSPYGMTFDTAGNMYFADAAAHRIHKLSTNGSVTTIAGTGTVGYSGDNGPATSAQLNGPYDVAMDRSGNLRIADTYNSRIRNVSPTGTITTLVS